MSSSSDKSSTITKWTSKINWAYVAWGIGAIAVLAITMYVVEINTQSYKKRAVAQAEAATNQTAASIVTAPPAANTPLDTEESSSLYTAPVQPSVVAQGGIRAIREDTKTSYSVELGTNHAGRYCFIVTDAFGSDVSVGNIEFAFSVASSDSTAQDAGCLNVTIDNFRDFTYTSHNCIDAMTGTLCVAALVKDENGNIVLIANQSFNLVADPTQVVQVNTKGISSIKESFMGLLRRKKKEKKEKKDKVETKSVASVVNTIENVISAIESALPQIESDVAAVETAIPAIEADLGLAAPK